MNYITILFCITTIFQSVSALAVKDKELQHIINETFKNIAAHEDLTGLQYTLMSADSIYLNYTGGLSDIYNNSPVTSTTTFMSYSSSKIITATAVLQLIERNLIHLDSRLSSYLRHPYQNTITIRQLLNHTSGIPNPLPLDWLHLSSTHASYNEQEFMFNIMYKNLDLDFEPGSKYAYSNISYYLLGFLIETVSGMSFTDYVTKNIFEPLGITPAEMSYTVNEQSIAKGYISKYSFLNMGLYLLSDSDLYGESVAGYSTFNTLYNASSAFGGLYSTATGWSKFLQDILREKPTLISAETKKLFFTQQRDSLGKSIETALGWHLGKNKNGALTTWHWDKPGGGAGFCSNVRIYPEKGVASIVLINTTHVTPQSIYQIIDAIDTQIVKTLGVW